MMNQYCKRAAVIGAGVSGLSCAQKLKKHGWEVDIFEKSRGIGGRLSVKRFDKLGAVDLGAQFFTIRTDEFKEALTTARSQNLIEPWSARIAYITAESCAAAKPEERWIGIPAMNSWLATIWDRSKISFETKVEKLKRESDGLWQINDKKPAYQAILLAIPAEQAADLIKSNYIESINLSTQMDPCWAGLYVFEKALNLDFDAAFMRLSGIDWIAANHSKPGRTKHPSVWTVHTNEAFARKIIDDSQEIAATKILEVLKGALQPLLGKLPECTMTFAHRWRYAKPSPQAAPGILWDSNLGLGSCGDWAIGGRVEGAFSSGRALAQAVLNDFG